jgi:beta-glucosidase
LQIGVAAQLSDTRAITPRNPLNRAGVAVKLFAWNWWFLNRIKTTQDFIGLNYYFTEYQDWLGRIKNPKLPVSDLGWYMEPSRIGELLVATWRRYHVPLLITENGLADNQDAQRQWWLEQTLGALEYARGQGVDLRGYLHWSLLDNFEWAYGWWPEFGLVHVDRTTMRRTIRPSARWFAERIKVYRTS